VVSAPPVATPPLPAPPGRTDLYVVVPDRDGRTGAVTVTTPSGGQQVLDRPYATARIRQPDRVEPGTADATEAHRLFGEALDAQPPRPVSFTLYFLEGTDELTAESKRMVTAVSAEIARRPAPEVVVVGHTDRLGTVEFNDRLSLQRAERVRTELVRFGIPPDTLQIAGRGEREPLVPTPDEVPEPRNRRVEITVR
jgi:outer membrane protein OmpA-like peptidoglycan-associated protein